MKVLMISEDPNIASSNSEARNRVKEYALLFDELHIVLPFPGKKSSEPIGNLFIYYACSPIKIIQKIKLFFLANRISKKVIFDVLSVQNSAELGVIGLMLKKMHKVRLSVQVHTDIFSTWYHRLSITDRIRYWLAFLVIPRADQVRVVSDRIRKSILIRRLTPDKKIKVLPIYTNTTPFLNSISDLETSRRFSKYVFKMIAVGRFVDKEKNFSMLIEVMDKFVKTYPETVLVIVGEGPDRESLKFKVKSLKLEKNIILEGWRNDLPSFYKNFDLFVMSSNYEGWGRVVIEAMASGLPILMTDVGVAGEIVGNEREGIIVPVRDLEALLRAMIYLYNNKDRLQQFGESALKKVTGLKPGTKEEYLKLYQRSFNDCLDI